MSKVSMTDALYLPETCRNDLTSAAARLPAYNIQLRHTTFTVADKNEDPVEYRISVLAGQGLKIEAVRGVVVRGHGAAFHRFHNGFPVDDHDLRTKRG